MIPLSLADVERLCPGRLVTAPGAGAVTGVHVDSRRVGPGDLFVVVGAGEPYVEAALAQGAAAALVPDDAHASLAALAGAVRARATARVVGITGSAGKTSTKDILAALCSPRARTVAAEASYNNEVGVPLTVCRLEADTEVCVLELAMRGKGQIGELCAFARPEIGVVTNVGAAHLGEVGTLEDVVEAKYELVAALPPGGTAIVPPGFPVRRSDLHVVVVGEPDARAAGSSTVLRFAGREVEVPFTARHQLRNTLAALHAAAALGLEVEGPVDVELSRWRGEEVALPGGGLLINDSYNANPLSMAAALDHLAARAAGRRAVAVLGDMAELGADAPSYHAGVGREAARLGLGALVAIGPLAAGYAAAAAGIPVVRHAQTVEEGIALAREVLEPGDVVLVKASRALGLEAVAHALAGVQVAR